MHIIGAFIPLIAYKRLPALLLCERYTPYLQFNGTKNVTALRHCCYAWLIAGLRHIAPELNRIFLNVASHFLFLLFFLIEIITFYRNNTVDLMG